MNLENKIKKESEKAVGKARKLEADLVELKGKMHSMMLRNKNRREIVRER